MVYKKIGKRMKGRPVTVYSNLSEAEKVEYHHLAVKKHRSAKSTPVHESNEEILPQVQGAGLNLLLVQ